MRPLAATKVSLRATVILRATVNPVPMCQTRQTMRLTQWQTTIRLPKTMPLV